MSQRDGRRLSSERADVKRIMAAAAASAADALIDRMIDIVPDVSATGVQQRLDQ